jgi:hypothetical protein
MFTGKAGFYSDKKSKYPSYKVTGKNSIYVYQGNPNKMDTLFKINIYYINTNSLKISRVGGSPEFEIYKKSNVNPKSLQ